MTESRRCQGMKMYDWSDKVMGARVALSHVQWVVYEHV